MKPDADAAWLAEVVVEAASQVGIGIAVTAMSPKLENVFVTEAMASLFGYERDEFLAKEPLDVFRGRERDRMSGFERAFAESGSVPSLVRATALHRSGREVRFDVTIAMTQIGEEPAVVSFAVDASRRRVAEESLAASEGKLLELLDRLPDPTLATRGGRVVFANRALRGLLDLPEAAAEDSDRLGDEVRILDASAAMDAASSTSPDEVSLSSSSGHRLTLEARRTRMELRGRPVDLWFCRDLTEHRQAEVQLMQADRLATLGTLAGGLAHAINNPLSSVVLNLEDLVRRMPELAERPELSEEVRERLALAKEGADRVAQVVSQLRVFSRMRRTDEVGDVDVRRVIEGAIELVANEIRHRGQLELSLRPVPMVRGFEGRIEHALLTLLIFAVRLLPDRPSGHSRLVVETHGEDEAVEVLVRCEGATLPDGFAESGADPFAPAGPRESGIGLAICGDTVRAMGGELSVRGSTGASTFLVRLPLPEEDSLGRRLSRPSDPRDVASGVRRARVLVIDDDAGVLSALRLMLQDAHDVTVMQSPHEAVREIVSGASYDVVFCDFVMPQMTGRDVYDAVSRERPGFEQRLVFMTGAAFQREAQGFLESVDNARIDKPFNLERVEALVRAAVA